LADRFSEPVRLAVSVVVPTHAGGELFGRCLDALARLSPPPLEVIVVDVLGEQHDLWDVNTERSYYEEQQVTEERAG